MDKPIRFNDLKAPRFNSRKFRKIIVDKELFRTWRRTNGFKKGSHSYVTFRFIWEKIAEEMIQIVLTERDGINLRGLGDIYLGYPPPSKHKPIDYKASQEYGKTIYHENWHTDGKVIRVIWGVTDRKYVLRRKYWWAFQECRNFERLTTIAARTTPELFKNSQERRHKIIERPEVEDFY